MPTKKKRVKDKREDVEMQSYIRRRANYSLAVLGDGFVRNGSGRFMNIRSHGQVSCSPGSTASAS